MSKNYIVITTGGTGGHFFPAIALGKKLFSNNYKVSIFLDKRAYAYKDDKNQGIRFKKILSLGLHKTNIFFLSKMLIFLALGFMQVFISFLLKRPKVVISFGGYSSLSVVLNAIIFRVPIIMHEQNAYLGKSHRLFAKFASVIALSFPDTKNIPKGVITKITGLPVRDEFVKLQSKKALKKDYLTITILGGSQGANIFGEIFPDTFSKLDIDIKKSIKVYHQCRDNMLEEVENKWKKTKINYKTKPFFNNIADIIWESDLIIARSGASSIAEINILGKYAIYIPFAKATNNHQELNALNAKDSYRASIILEKDFNQANLLDKLNDFFMNKNKYLKDNKDNSIIKNASKDLYDLVIKEIK